MTSILDDFTPRAFAGLALGLAIGAGCRLAGLPLPAPPVLVGALLVVAMTLGFIVADARLSRRKPSTTAAQCGGPTGIAPGGGSALADPADGKATADGAAQTPADKEASS